jgi:hypothetical protein
VWKKLGSGTVYKCFVCEVPRPQPVGQPVGPRPGPTSGPTWDHGWNQWHRWHDGPEIIVEGAPETAVVAEPTPSAPVRVSAPAPAPRMQSQAAVEPCNCLTKQSLPDGSVLFQDICTKESAIAAPQIVGAR